MAKKPVKYCVVDAFTASAFKGNPAAVCLLEEPREDDWLQSVAKEFNLSETCYLSRIDGPKFHLRWFTPVAEVRLCGHATLAAAHFLFAYDLVGADRVEFSTLSGILTARKVPPTELSDSSYPQGDGAQGGFTIELDFPVVPVVDFNCDADVVSKVSKSLGGVSVIEIKKIPTANDLLVVLSSGDEVAKVKPQFDEIQNCPGVGMLVTGLAPPDSGFDFFSRYFCPELGINEDPVTGSAHCALAPYWNQKLGKSDFVAFQASPRSGVLILHLQEQNQRVLLQGKAAAVMEGSLLV